MLSTEAISYPVSFLSCFAFPIPKFSLQIAGGFLSKNKIQQLANAMEKVLKAISRKHFSEENDVTDVEKKIIGEVRRHHDL